MIDLWQSFLILFILILGIGIVIFSYYKFELALVLILLSPWFSAVFVPNGPSLSEVNMGSYLRVSIVLSMGIVGLIKFFSSWSLHRGKVPYHLIILGGFLSIASISIFYSIDQKFTLVRVVSFWGIWSFLLGLNAWLINYSNLKKVFNSIFYVVVFFIFINSISPFIFPSKTWLWNAPNRFQGLWGHPNYLGSFCMVAYFILLWKYFYCSFRMKKFIIILILITFIMHIFTGSRGSLLASLIGLSVWYIAQGKKIKFFLYIGIISTIIFAIFTLNRARFEREKNPNSITYLTGRTDFWKAAFILIQERPLTGYGFDVEGKIWQDPRFNHPKLRLWSGSAKTSIHNGYISIAVGVGVGGFIIWVIVLLSPILYYIKLPRSLPKAWGLSILIMTLTLNFIESTVTGGRSFTSIIFWIAWTMVYHIPTENES